MRKDVHFDPQTLTKRKVKNFLLGLVPEKQDYSANKPSELRKMVSAKLKKTRS